RLPEARPATATAGGGGGGLRRRPRMVQQRERWGVWTTHGPDDGQVNAIAVDPSTPTTVYAATEFGGFFKSLDGGDTWSPIGGGLTDPAPPDLDVLAGDVLCRQ